MKQTATEWLFEWMENKQYFIGNDLLDAFNQAKEMEKYQIVTAYKCGKVESNFPPEQFTTGYMYYEEEYGNKGQK